MNVGLQEDSSTLRKKVVVAGLVFAATCTVLAALAEGILRWFDPIGISYVFEARRYFDIMVDDPDFAYIHRPGYAGAFQDVPVRINGEGFRGPEFPGAKQPGELRLVVLGDSVAFGWGVREEQSIAPLLGPALGKQLADVRIVTLGVGVGSWNTRTQVEFMKKRGFDYAPDVIVWIVVPNDITPKATGRTHVQHERLRLPAAGADPTLLGRWYRRLAYRSYSVAAIQRLIATREQNAELLSQYARGSPFREDVSDAFHELAALCEGKGILLFGVRYGRTEGDLGRTYHAYYRGLFDEAALRSWELPEAIYDPRLQNSRVDSHPNAEGLRIITDAIATALLADERFVALAEARTGRTEGRR